MSSSVPTLTTTTTTLSLSSSSSSSSESSSLSSSSSSSSSTTSSKKRSASPEQTKKFDEEQCTKKQHTQQQSEAENTTASTGIDSASATINQTNIHTISRSIGTTAATAAAAAAAKDEEMTLNTGTGADKKRKQVKNGEKEKAIIEERYRQTRTVVKEILIDHHDDDDSNNGNRGISLPNVLADLILDYSYHPLITLWEEIEMKRRRTTTTNNDRHYSYVSPHRVKKLERKYRKRLNDPHFQLPLDLKILWSLCCDDDEQQSVLESQFWPSISTVESIVRNASSALQSTFVQLETSHYGSTYSSRYDLRSGVIFAQMFSHPHGSILERDEETNEYLVLNKTNLSPLIMFESYSHVLYCHLTIFGQHILSELASYSSSIQNLRRDEKEWNHPILSFYPYDEPGIVPLFGSFTPTQLKEIRSSITEVLRDSLQLRINAAQAKKDANNNENNNDDGNYDEDDDIGDDNENSRDGNDDSDDDDDDDDVEETSTRTPDKPQTKTEFTSSVSASTFAPSSSSSSSSSILPQQPTITAPGASFKPGSGAGKSTEPPESDTSDEDDVAEPSSAAADTANAAAAGSHNEQLTKEMINNKLLRRYSQEVQQAVRTHLCDTSNQHDHSIAMPNVLADIICDYSYHPLLAQWEEIELECQFGRCRSSGVKAYALIPPPPPTSLKSRLNKKKKKKQQRYALPHRVDRVEEEFRVKLNDPHFCFPHELKILWSLHDGFDHDEQRLVLGRLWPSLHVMKSIVRSSPSALQSSYVLMGVDEQGDGQIINTKYDLRSGVIYAHKFECDHPILERKADNSYRLISEANLARYILFESYSHFFRCLMHHRIDHSDDDFLLIAHVTWSWSITNAPSQVRTSRPIFDLLMPTDEQQDDESQIVLPSSEKQISIENAIELVLRDSLELVLAKAEAKQANGQNPDAYVMTNQERDEGDAHKVQKWKYAYDLQLES